jgi:hypothetical protein
LRVLILDTYYPAFIASHYGRRPGLGEESYDTQLRELMACSFGTSDAYSHNLRSIGHEATEVIVNCIPLQRRWAAENGLRSLAVKLASALDGLTPISERGGRLLARRSGVLHAIALAQVARFQPDVIYLQDIGFHTTRQLRQLAAPSRLLVGQLASKAPPLDRLRALDLVLTSFPHFVERFRRAGIDSEGLRLAFDERVLQHLRDVTPSPRHDLVFVGGLDRRVHPEGVEMLERVAMEFGESLAVYGYGASTLPTVSKLRSCYRGQAWGLDMYVELARSKLALNRHIATAEGWSNNMRLFEATGVGAALLTDKGRNLGDFFEIGHEVRCYSDVPQLIEIAHQLLADDGARVRLAAAGQQRTLSDHTFAARMVELVAILEPRLAARLRSSGRTGVAHR